MKNEWRNRLRGAFHSWRDLVPARALARLANGEINKLKERKTVFHAKSHYHSAGIGQTNSNATRNQ
jgi:hypothetical protein